jgi:hypothetical protein
MSNQQSQCSLVQLNEEGDNNQGGSGGGAGSIEQEAIRNQLRKIKRQRRREGGEAL